MKAMKAKTFGTIWDVQLHKQKVLVTSFLPIVALP